MFISNQISRALFVPPYHWRVIVRSAYGLEDLGSQWLNHLGGVVMIEASKQIYAPSKIKSVRNRDRRLMPSAVARVSALQKGNIQR